MGAYGCNQDFVSTRVSPYLPLIPPINCCGFTTKSSSSFSAMFYKFSIWAHQYNCWPLHKKTENVVKIEIHMWNAISLLSLLILYLSEKHVRISLISYLWRNRCNFEIGIQLLTIVHLEFEERRLGFCFVSIVQIERRPLAELPILSTDINFNRVRYANLLIHDIIIR